MPQVLPRTSSERASYDIECLISAIECDDDTIVRSRLNTALASTGPSVLTAPCMKRCHFNRTPFMAAAARGVLSIFVILLNAFDKYFTADEVIKLLWRLIYYMTPRQRKRRFVVVC